MVQYFYDTSLNGNTTKPLDIYRGTEKIGVVRGSYDNIIKKFIDEFGDSKFSPSFLKYELKDNPGLVRIITKPLGFMKGKIAVSYLDSDDNKHEILMKDMKNVSFGSKQVEFEYRETNCLIYKERSTNPLNPKPAEMYIGERLIADWKIDVSNKQVVVNILDLDFMGEEYLILGLFHAYLYATKG
ncbi:hypothetical protein [Lentibacillus sediminis]|uniref:tubby C-terminal domain-like protein n=1 Tax=Lentibacillus sediminis TaxID=1940529 RepID=UPI000C1C53FF|nr:hypothetical protein [Lentibacillus sediminis]